MRLRLKDMKAGSRVFVLSTKSARSCAKTLENLRTVSRVSRTAIFVGRERFDAGTGESADSWIIPAPDYLVQKLVRACRAEVNFDNALRDIQEIRKNLSGKFSRQRTLMNLSRKIAQLSHEALQLSREEE